MKVPKSVIQALQSALSARIRHSKLFAQQTGITPEIARSNQSHAHFNAVLQQTLDILMPLQESQSLTQHDQERSTMSRDQIELPRFQSLDIEDASGDDSDSKNAPAESSGTAARVPVRSRATKHPLPISSGPEYTVEAPENEWLTVLACALDDMHRLQDRIRGLCQDYKYGEIDCGTLSMTANTAVDMVGQLEAQFLESFPRFKGGLEHLDLFEQHARQTRGQPSSIPNSINTDDIGQLVYSLPRRAIESWQIDPIGMPICPLDHVEEPYQTLIDCKLLVTMMQQMYDLGIIWMKTDARMVRMPILDKLSYIAARLGDDADHGRFTIPLHAIFAAQIFLEINHTLGDKCSKGLQDLQLATGKHRQIIEGYQRFSKSVYAKRIFPKEQKALQETLSLIEEWVKKDMVNDLRRAAEQDPVKPMELLKNHPWLCGAVRLTIDLLLSKIGINQWNSYSYAIPLAQIYNAAWQQGFLDAQWADMEKIFDMHPPKHIFAGSRPTKGSQYGPQYACAEGVSPVTFAKNRRVIYNKAAKERRLVHLARLASLYLDHTNPNDAILCLRPPLLDKILEEEPYKINSVHLERSEILRRKWLEQRQSLSPDEMITYAKERLLGERDSLRFNYLGLSQPCHHIGRRLVQPIHDLLIESKQWGRADAVKSDTDEKGIPITTYFACETYEMQSPRDPIREKVTDLLNGAVSTEGDAESKALSTTYQMESRTAATPKPQSSAFTQPEPSAPSRQDSKEEVLPSTSAASGWPSTSVQEDSTQPSREGKEKEVLPSTESAEETEHGQDSGSSRKGKEKEVLPSTESTEETEDSQDSGSSGTDKEGGVPLPAGSSEETDANKRMARGLASLY
ncbi:MAG: hypothetical protein LQ352_005927 [Teloschistes flavicans]|nr:MAG: hypothetical protein LQ352_005927 [Teloschistes flavicans]